ELYNTATDFIIIDKGRIIEELSEAELNEKCKQHIEIRTTDSAKAIVVLQDKLHTDNFKVMPDGSIRLYDFLHDTEKVAVTLAGEQVIVTGLKVTGDTLEQYFLDKVGGVHND
ncbi:MAG: ABC transporter ATP-binding protein, partial [Clostridiales bacterium]|nr:ABC transporter ATP-binding protein [Clostridiales bacterium]